MLKRLINPQMFAQEWIAAWNRRDIEFIVSHFTNDARFTSPLAVERTGRPLIVGHESLKSYWSGSKSYKTFVFTLGSMVWDPSSSTLVIVYSKNIDGRHSRAAEILHFDANGLIDVGEAMYGITD